MCDFGYNGSCKWQARGSNTRLVVFSNSAEGYTFC